MIPGYDTAVETMRGAAHVHRVGRAWRDPERDGWSAQCLRCGHLVNARTPLDVEFLREEHAVAAALDAFLALPSRHPCDHPMCEDGFLVDEDAEAWYGPEGGMSPPCPRGCKDGMLTNQQVLGGE